jgi:Flp pilus assembly protein TadD
MPRLLTALIALSLGGVAALSPGSGTGPGPGTGTGAATGTGWTRVSTEHFVVSGDAPAADIGRVAARLESLRAVLTQLLPRTQDHSLLPAFVVVFGSDRSFEPYQPAGVTVGGYALLDRFIPCMVLRSDGSDESFRTIVHEYVHVLFDAPWLPLWLSEGIADYYSATTLSRDRRQAVLGDRIPAHLAQATRGWVPLSRVLALSRSSRLSNDDTSMSVYAESWLLVHYLTRGTPARGAQIARFIDLLSAGATEAAAFEQAIGSPATIEADLRRYLGNGIVYGEERSITRSVDVAALRPRPMTAAEVDGVLGRLLFHLRRDDEAASRLNASLGADPDLSEPVVTLGVMHVRQGRRADALACFRRASARDPGNLLAAYHQGLMALDGTRAATEPPLQEAYAALNRAVEGRREVPPEPLATLGTLAGRLGRLDEAEAILRQANRLEPGQSGTRLELANVCLRVGKFQEARGILDGLSSGPESPDAGAARLCRDWLALAETRAQVRSELAEIAGLPDPGPDRAIAKTGSFPSAPRLRTPGVGEERRLGLLDAVDCPGADFIARVSTRSGPVSVLTASLARVHLFSARDDVSGVLACGPRPQREAVYVTWKGDHQLVAIEFLPLDLQPGR